MSGDAQSFLIRTTTPASIRFKGQVSLGFHSIGSKIGLAIVHIADASNSQPPLLDPSSTAAPEEAQAK